MTSSARERTVVGMSSPIPFAVFKFTTSSYLVGACTGRLAGFSPLRMRFDDADRGNLARKTPTRRPQRIGPARGIRSGIFTALQEL